MMDSVSCRRAIFDESTKALAEQIQHEMDRRDIPIRLEHLPSIQHVLPEHFASPAAEVPDVEPYPPPTQAPDLESISHYIHSSGSTGFPKSIHFTCARFLQMARRGTSISACLRARRSADAFCSAIRANAWSSSCRGGLAYVPWNGLLPSDGAASHHSVADRRVHAPGS